MKDGETSIVAKDVGALRKAAKEILAIYPHDYIFAFYGEMGAGKTTFIKVLCSELDVIDTVTSPTFAIVNIYKTGSNKEIYHFDTYRLKSLSEFYDIGYEDYFYSGNYCFIEWPEKIEKLLPENVIRVHIRVETTDNSRIISF